MTAGLQRIPNAGGPVPLAGQKSLVGLPAQQAAQQQALTGQAQSAAQAQAQAQANLAAAALAGANQTPLIQPVPRAPVNAAAIARSTTASPAPQASPRLNPGAPLIAGVPNRPALPTQLAALAGQPAGLPTQAMAAAHQAMLRATQGAVHSLTPEQIQNSLDMQKLIWVSSERF